MSTFSRLMLAMLLAAGSAVAETPGLGVALSAEEVERLDFTVLPDGQGLPRGSGTAAAGEALYARHCQACHGEKGQNGTNDRLAGGHGSIGGPVPAKTVGSYWPYATTVFDYIRRAMPLQSPGILSDDELYAITAYVLYINDIVGRDEVLNAKTLASIKMPNRDNFDWAVTP